MKRIVIGSALLVVVLPGMPILLADVKTREKTTIKFEGLIGGMLTRAAGGSDGITSTVAIKGNRMARIDDNSGQIIDLSEEKIYVLDMKKKQYSVLTFAEMRKQMEEARKSLEEQSKSMNAEDKQAVQDAGKQLEVDVDVKETGQRKSIAGQDTRQVIVTLVMREKGKKLEESGGLVMTDDMWVAAKVAAMDELLDFNMKYFKAVFGGTFTGLDAQQTNMVSAFLPGFGRLAERMASEGKKLEGTPVLTTMTFEIVKSAEQMKAASEQQQSGGGGGIGGALAGRLMRGRGQTQPRTKAFTSTHELLSIAPAASETDVAIPGGFKEKK